MEDEKLLEASKKIEELEKTNKSFSDKISQLESSNKSLQDKLEQCNQLLLHKGQEKQNKEEWEDFE